MNVNKIRLTHYVQQRGDGQYGAIKTEVNGVEMVQVREVSLRCHVDDLPVLKLTQLVDAPLDVELHGMVDPICLMTDNGFDLLVDHPTPHSTRYRAVKRET